MMLPPRFFFVLSTIGLIVLLMLLPLISHAFLPLWAILFWSASWVSGGSFVDMRKENQERHAETKKPFKPDAGEQSANGAGNEPFGKRDTTAYIIEKGRNSRW